VKITRPTGPDTLPSSVGEANSQQCLTTAVAGKRAEFCVSRMQWPSRLWCHGATADVRGESHTRRAPQVRVQDTPFVYSMSDLVVSWHIDEDCSITVQTIAVIAGLRDRTFVVDADLESEGSQSHRSSCLLVVYY